VKDRKVKETKIAGHAAKDCPALLVGA